MADGYQFEGWAWSAVDNTAEVDAVINTLCVGAANCVINGINEDGRIYLDHEDGNWVVRLESGWENDPLRVARPLDGLFDYVRLVYDDASDDHRELLSLREQLMRAVEKIDAVIAGTPEPYDDAAL